MTLPPSVVGALGEKSWRRYYLSDIMFDSGCQRLLHLPWLILRFILVLHDTTKRLMQWSMLVPAGACTFISNLLGKLCSSFAEQRKLLLASSPDRCNGCQASPYQNVRKYLRLSQFLTVGT